MVKNGNMNHKVEEVGMGEEEEFRGRGDGLGAVMDPKKYLSWVQENNFSLIFHFTKI